MPVWLKQEQSIALEFKIIPFGESWQIMPFLVLIYYTLRVQFSLIAIRQRIFAADVMPSEARYLYQQADCRTQEILRCALDNGG